MAQAYAKAFQRMDLRNKAVAANAAELPFLETKRLRLNEVVTEVRSLTAEQASFAARKQEVSKRLAELVAEGSTLVTVVDTVVRQHYGNRAEKLTEFGLQPFRSRPRNVVFVGPDGKRLKAPAAVEEPPVPPVTS